MKKAACMPPSLFNYFATTRLAAETIASSEAPTMLSLIPTPNNFPSG